MTIYGSESREKKTVWKETSAPKPRLEPQGLLDDGICDRHRRGGALCRSLVYDHVGWGRPDPVGFGTKGSGNPSGPVARGREHWGFYRGKSGGRGVRQIRYESGGCAAGSKRDTPYHFRGRVGES